MQGLQINVGTTELTFTDKSVEYVQLEVVRPSTSFSILVARQMRMDDDQVRLEKALGNHKFQLKAASASAVESMCSEVLSLHSPAANQTDSYVVMFRLQLVLSLLITFKK